MLRGGRVSVGMQLFCLRSRVGSVAGVAAVARSVSVARLSCGRGDAAMDAETDVSLRRR